MSCLEDTYDLSVHDGRWLCFLILHTLAGICNLPSGVQDMVKSARCDDIVCIFLESAAGVQPYLWLMNTSELFLARTNHDIWSSGVRSEAHNCVRN